MRRGLLIPVVALTIVAGCAAKGASPAPESTIQGTAALTSYRSTPSAIVATNEAGARATALLGADGAFTLPLPKGHIYKLAMVTAKGDVPLVFPRRRGVLAGSVAVKSNGAREHLGLVRYLASAPPGGFHFAATHAEAAHVNFATPGEPGADEPSHHEDMTGDNNEQVDDSSQVTCDNGAQGHDDGQSRNAQASGDEVDASHEMSVAEHNMPDAIDGCESESSGDNNDDHDKNQDEQSGEHKG